MVAEAPMPAQMDAGPQKRNPLPIGMAVRLKVKNLYLIQDLDYQSIAKECGLNQKQVANLVTREGWAEQKRAAHSLLEQKHDARANAAQLAIVEAIAGQAEEICLSGLDRARDAVKRKGKDAAKNFQSWTGGVRNLVGAMKTIRAKDSDLGASGSATINFFFVKAGDAPTEAKQVTEIEPAKTSLADSQ